jgi:hypothetical protein
MINEGFDALNNWLDTERARDRERYLNGCCVGCGGRFFIGLAEAEQEGGLAGKYFLCFWCMTEEDRDPYTGEYPPSQWQYGNC